MPILIKRYANRKLYNTSTSRYITLKGIAELIDEGEKVQVIDNETGEDITSVALSQILVDTERSNGEVTQSLLSQILERGGDVLYSALRKGVDDATGSLEDFQDRVRRIVQFPDGGAHRGHGEDDPGTDPDEAESGRPESPRMSDWIAYASPDVERSIHSAVERVFKLVDLPLRSEIDSLNRNLERVAQAVESLDERLCEMESRAPHADEEARETAPTARPADVG